jgi:hypothetical protein
VLASLARLQNIAIETGHLIDLGTDIHDGEEVADTSDPAVKKLIWEADGFAGTMPSTKRSVVECLKIDFGCVVGMTGDGVNDAPALSMAQVGVAVEGATDAAKNAAAIILTESGLSPIFGAVCTSRQIFRKVRSTPTHNPASNAHLFLSLAQVKSYVVFRIAASITIVLVLCILIFVSACQVRGVLIVLLALLNDLSMLPIAYDNVSASRKPELPRADEIVYRALCVAGGGGGREKRTRAKQIGAFAPSSRNHPALRRRSRSHPPPPQVFRCHGHLLLVRLLLHGVPHAAPGGHLRRESRADPVPQHALTPLPQRARRPGSSGKSTSPRTPPAPSRRRVSSGST